MPQPGPQNEAIRKHWVEELFYGGAVGGGKSDFLLGDFAQDVPGPWGKYWYGILFRRTYPELEELIGRSQEIYPAWFPNVKWSESKTTWTWPNGAELKMRYLEHSTDWMRYWGHQYTWIGWDELPGWPDMTPYNKMKARLRSAHGVPNKRIRATGNPGGTAHHAVKAHWRIDEYPLGGHLFKAGGMTRMFIRSRLQDNAILMKNDPAYMHRLSGLGSPELVRAWLEGDWSVVAGAFFSEFSIDKHVVEPVELPAHWTRFVCADWGSAKPFAVYWVAVSDGELPQFPRGCLVVYREWYGVKTNEAGEFEPNVGIKLTADKWGEGIRARTAEKINYWVIDPAALSHNGGPSIAENSGLPWQPGDNTRVGRNGAMGGADQFRARLVGEDDRPMIVFFRTCRHAIRTVPALQHDDHKPEDVDSNGEDHAYDGLRYGCMSRPYVKDNPQPQPAKYPVHRTIDQMLKAHIRKKRAE